MTTMQTNKRSKRAHALNIDIVTVDFNWVKQKKTTTKNNKQTHVACVACIVYVACIFFWCLCCFWCLWFLTLVVGQYDYRTEAQ